MKNLQIRSRSKTPTKSKLTKNKSWDSVWPEDEDEFVQSDFEIYKGPKHTGQFAMAGERKKDEQKKGDPNPNKGKENKYPEYPKYYG